MCLIGNFYEGGETDFVKVSRNSTYAELCREVQGIENVDITRFTIELRTLVDTSVRLRPARPKIKNDSDVEMLLYDDGHVPKVYVSGLEKVSAELGNVGVPTVQPVYQTFLQQLEARLQSAGGSNNIWGTIPTTYPTFEIPSVNPIISEDPTIDEVVDPYNEDVRSIPEYNSYIEYGLDDGVNDEPAHYHEMSSDPTDGCHTGSVPPVFIGSSTDTFEDDGINDGDRSGTEVPWPWIIHGVSNYSFELVRIEESSSSNWIILKFVLQGQARQDMKLAVRILSANFKSVQLRWKLLPVYCHQLKCMNLGTITAIKIDTARKFKYLTITLSASLEGFYTTIQPAICIDATYLKECEDSWTWFLKELKKTIGCPANCIIISDGSFAIKVAMTKEYSEITHDLCGFHMNRNLKNIFKNHVVCNLFREASMAQRESEFLEKMQELSRVNRLAYEYLMRVWPHRWSRVYCPVRRYRGMTSNIVKCFVKRILSTSVLISTKQEPGWKSILVSSFPLDTQANGILLKKYVPKLFFHHSGELKLVGRERIRFHLQVSMVVGVGTVPSVRNLATTDKIVQTPSRSARHCSGPTNRSTTAPTSLFHEFVTTIVVELIMDLNRGCASKDYVEIADSLIHLACLVMILHFIEKTYIEIVMKQVMS
ncbi:hypothetical protein Dsin_001952 [Dipteronia sinensis]|uniref:MULE transposase domain-containing protein n=1 Tax=Dipteronia sinensis TaxID=43782 RepID=A0AAE0B5C5_9ROSI|nr:hypothetical protein Dsin_001952 [Dipteronia sinensis]